MAKQNKNPQIQYEEQEGNSPIGKIFGIVAAFCLAALIIYISVMEPQPGTGMAAIRSIICGLGGSVHLLLAMVLCGSACC